MGAIITRILIALGVSTDVASKIGNAFTLAVIALLLRRILSFLWKLVSYQLFLGAVCAALTLFPDTIGWIFLKLGEVQLRVIAVVLASVMPDIFGAGSGSYTSWGQLWQQGLNLLPTQMLEIINGLGVAYILGLVTSTFSAVATIKIYRRSLKRAGLM